MTGISDIQRTLVAGAAEQNDRQVRQTAQRSDGASATVADRSVLSSASAQLQATLGGNDDIRADKVASLRAAIANGSYQVPAGKLADSLIQSMLNSPASRRG